uniref:C-type lectin domain-containing protein n=1 Tax=Panagrellus redivivus TaxID=6233 RepID=A0A7E4VLY9_PANRE
MELNAVYAEASPCPDGSTNEGTFCLLTTKFGAGLPIKSTVSGLGLPLKGKIWYCANPIFTEMRNIGGTHYCYAVIPIWRTGERITARKAMEHCVKQTGGTFASIHSEEENNVIAELGKYKRAIGVGIELIDNNGLSERSSYRWTDGTPIDYTKFHNLARGYKYLFPFGAIFNDRKSWYTRWNSYEEFASRLSSIACKTPAVYKIGLKEIPANLLRH